MRAATFLSRLGRAGTFALLVACASDPPATGGGGASEGPAGDGAADVSSDTPAGNVDDPWLSGPPAEGETRAYVVADESKLLTGPKAEGRPGDILLENSRAAFLLEGLRTTGGYRHEGGWPSDVALRAEDGSLGEDRFGEMPFAWNLDVLVPDAIEVLDDGRDGGAARVRVTGATGRWDFAQSAVGFFFSLPPPDLSVTVDYTLEPDVPWLRLDIALGSADAVEIDLAAVMAHFGDGAFMFTPGSGFSQGESAGPIPYYAAAGRGLAYGLVSAEDDLESLFTYSGVSILGLAPFAVPAGGEVSKTYWIGVSGDGVAGIAAMRRRLLDAGGPVRLVSGEVLVPESASLEEAWVAVRDLEGGVVATVPVRAGGAFTAEVEPGEYVAIAHAPGHAPSEAVGLDVTAADQAITLEVPASAVVSVSVSDLASGGPVPARVTFRRTGATPDGHAPPDVRLVQKSWGGDTAAVAYVTGAEETVVLPAGTYVATASRGFSYEIDVQDVTLAAGANAPLAFEIERVVDTTGWLSADFHVHAFRSPDSYVPYEIRARQAATEDLDLPILTEHVYIGDLTEAAGAAGVSEHLVTFPAQEVTTFSYGHFNAFPLLWKPEAPNLGAVWEHDRPAPALFEAIRAQGPGDEIIQVNHPTGASPGNYFGYVGLDAVNDTVEKPEEWSLDFDAVEVWNGRCLDPNNLKALADWTAMTNHGHKKTMASGSDTHSESSVPGTPRNWIQVDEATVREDPEDLVPPVRARRLFVSCGPFVRFEAVSSTGETLAGLGEMTGVDDEGNVRFHARVEAPSWMQVDEVRLIENGAVVDAVVVSGSADPVVRFDGSFDAKPAADAWYALEVVGSGSMAPVTWSGSPYARTNPIDVDAGGDGTWTPPGN